MTVVLNAGEWRCAQAARAEHMVLQQKHAAALRQADALLAAQVPTQKGRILINNWKPGPKGEVYDL